MHLQSNNLKQPVIVSGVATALSRSALPALPPAILAVDDSRMQLEWLTTIARNWGCQLTCATNGAMALELLNVPNARYDLIILDQEMPDIKGLQLLKSIQAIEATRTAPVIMLTGNIDNLQLEDEINAGVFYHLLKPVPPELLRSVIVAALRENSQKSMLLSELSHHNKALRQIHNCTMSIKTLTEAEDAACLLAQCFPRPLKVVSGFVELLINAIEHGNLELSYHDKTRLTESGKWHEEIAERLLKPGYRDRIVNIVFQRKPDGCVAQITDQGKGFDWKKYWHIDPSHATSSHGRGIPRARLMAFDKVSYNESGNQVTVYSASDELSPLKW